MDDRRLDRWRKGLVTRSAAETEAAGEELAEFLPEGITLLLEGDLGAGKTTLVRGLARGLGVEGDITSPTFALLNVHQGTRRQLLHVDAYRLTAPGQIEGLLLDELARPPYNVVIEWPSRIAGHEPKGAWRLGITTEGADERLLRLG
jgi:tRNA threonylcarbamoyladenosine biosynthesis protein TsaE